MDDKKPPVELLLERAEAYAKTSLDLFKLKLIEKIAGLFSNLAVGFFIISIFTLFFINLNIGIGLLLGKMLGQNWLGFVLLSGIYLLLGIILFFFRNRLIKTPINDSIINQLVDEEHS